jgi:hypothetical protein
VLTCYQHPPRAGGDTLTILPPGSWAPRAAALAVDPQAIWVPWAHREALPDDMGGVLSASHGLVLHVQEGGGDPWGWFDRPDVEASSHWWVSLTGVLVQYVPATRAAWAQQAGNSGWHSVETEGLHTGPLTGEQVTALRYLYDWGAYWWGWPRRLAESTTGTGLGWHGMGGAAWGGHVNCPGVPRRAQRAQIIVPIGGDDGMPGPSAWTDDDWTAYNAHAGTRPPPAVTPTIRQPDMDSVAGATYNKAGSLQTAVAALTSAVAAAVPAHAAELAVARAALAIDHVVVPASSPADIVAGALAAIDDAHTLVRIAHDAASRAAQILAPPTTTPPGEGR